MSGGLSAAHCEHGVYRGDEGNCKECCPPPPMRVDICKECGKKVHLTLQGATYIGDHFCEGPRPLTAAVVRKIIREELAEALAELGKQLNK